MPKSSRRVTTSAAKPTQAAKAANPIPRAFVVTAKSAQAAKAPNPIPRDFVVTAKSARHASAQAAKPTQAAQAVAARHASAEAAALAELVKAAESFTAAKVAARAFALYLSDQRNPYDILSTVENVRLFTVPEEQSARSSRSRSVKSLRNSYQKPRSVKGSRHSSTFVQKNNYI